MNAPQREEFLKERQIGIGGSDIAAILGISPYRTAVDVWQSKTNRGADYEMSEPAYWGIALEDVVASEYTRRTGTKVERLNRQLSHPERPWMIANIDRICWQGGKAPVVRNTGKIVSKHLLEVKTASAWLSNKWDKPNEYGDEPMPVEYVAQCMWYMGVTDAEIVDVAVLIGGQRYEQRRVERDDAVIAAMVERAEAFWFGHVVPDIAPAPTNGADAYKLFPQDTGAAIEADDSLLDAIYSAKRLDEQIRELTAKSDEKKNFIKTRMLDASSVTHNGKPLVTWKKSSDSLKTNWPAVAKDLKTWAVQDLGLPAGDAVISTIIDLNTKPETGTRRFIFKE